MLEHAPFEVVGYTADGIPTTGADAVVAKGLDGWGLARQAMSPGHSLRIVAPPEGPEPWLRGPDAIVKLRTPGDDRWYPVDRSGEWAQEGFADPWAALAAVRDRPVLRGGALVKSRRGGGRRAALRRMGDDDAFVALRFGRRVVVWPVNQCEACGGDGMASGSPCATCGGGGRVTRGGERRFWIDGRGAPTELLDAEQAAAAIDVIIGTTNTTTEADRAAWGLDMENRGEASGRAPTVRQREVLSRVGDEFTVAELQESACHRYAGHTQRMASEMVARGAIEALGEGRYRKTALAVPSCVREPAKPVRRAPKKKASARATRTSPPKAEKPIRKASAKPKRRPKARMAPQTEVRAQVGDRMVMPASFNRLDVAEVRPDARVMVRDRHGDLHGPWSPAAQAARIWFRPRTEPAFGGGSRVVLDPINDDARAIAPDAPARLAAHWADAAVFLPVLDDDQRRFLIAVAELGVAPVSAVLERLGWTLARLRQLVPSITSMAQSHDMPLPFVAGTVDGERVWLWRPDGGDVMPADPLAEAVRDVPKDKRGIYGVAADGRVLPIGVAKHNSRLNGAKKALPLILGAIDTGGPWTVVAVRPGKGRPQHIERVVAERLVSEAPAAGKRIERVVLYTRRPYLLAEAGPEAVAPPKRIDFKAFTAHRDHSDGSKVYAGPNGTTVLLRAGKMWWVLRLAADRVWIIVAGPSKFAAARSAALEAAGQPAPTVSIPAQLAPVPSDAEIDDTARGVGGRAAKMLRKLMTVAQRGDRVVLDPLAGAPMVVRLAEVEAQSPRFWERNPVWIVENNGQSMGAREVGKVVALIAAGQRVEPTEEATEGFDLGWLKHRLRAYGCTKLWAMTGSLRVLICGPDDTHTATINREADGWHWKQTYKQNEVGGGPFQRASALVDDLVARLGLTLQADAPPEPTFVLVGCVKGKATEAAAARDLYRGALWDLRRRYAEARGLPWGVVSGGLGVVGADERVEPYDQRIQDLTAAQRKAWAKKAQAGLERLAGRGAVVVVIASRPYVEALAKPAKALGITLVAPLEGKGIGARKKWLAEQIAALGGETQPASAADVRDAVKGWARKGKPPVYTAPSGVVRFGRLGPKGQYRVQRREGGQWRVHGPDHRSFAKASRAAVDLVDEGWRDDGGRLPTLAPEAAPDVAQSEQLGLTVDVGQPPADVPGDRRLAWMIRQAAERLGRPTRGVWVVCGTEVHPIGALPDGIDVELPAVFVDMNPSGTVEAVDADPGFLLAVEPVSQALRRYRLKLGEGQRKRLLDALRLARGEGKRLRDATGIRRRLTEGFRREQVLAKHEVWTDKARSMSWVTPKGASNDQVIEAFFKEMARRLAEGLPEEIRERAEQVLVRAFRMARRRGGPRPRMSRPKPPAPPSSPSKTARPDRSNALRGFGADGQIEWESSVADFCASNAEDPALCARVKALGPGEHIDVGGGAAPHLRIVRRPSKGWPKASSKSSSPPAEAYEVIAGHHTRYDYPIWTVRLTDRVPKERFDALKALAKRSADAKSKVRTGYYSSYRKNGATPGFVFGSEAEARRFVRAAFGGAAAGREDDGGRLPTLAVKPKPGEASGAATEWPEVPFMPGPRTVANVRAVRIAHEARRSGATPTPEQRRHLLQYSGWGGLSIEKVKKDWPDGIPLPNSRALVHEYYTPWTICADIAAVVRRLVGPRSGAVRALEPSAGVGRFVHTARFPGWHWTAIELSPLSALILDQTVERPAVVHEGSFEGWLAANPDKRFEVIISNPPYGPRGEQMVEDKDRRFRVKAAYQYFILRGLSILAPGGVAAFLVPGGFLTGSSNGKLRAKIDRDADLLAAFRLPSGTFPGARLSLDVVFFRARAAAKTAPDSVFVDGTYFDNHPQHVLGEVKASGRWGGPEVIGEYRGLPDFEPREPGREDGGGRLPTLPATDSFADPVRVSEPFVSLHALQAASNRAYNYGKAFRPGDVPTVSKAGWRAAVEDVVRSPRGKGQRLKDLRVALEDLRAAANKASAYEQGGKFTRDRLTRDDARQLVFRLRDGRDAIKAGIAAIKDQSRRKVPRVDVKAPRFRAWAQQLGAEHLAGLSALAEWDTLRVTDVAGLAELEQARFIRVVAVDGHGAHIRLTDHGKKTLAAHPPAKAPAVRRPTPAAVEASVVRDEPAGDPPKGLLGDALLGLDWNTPDEVYLDMLGRGIAPAHAARAVATAFAHKHGASPADVERMVDELRLRNARTVDARVVDITPLADPTAVPPGIGVFAVRPNEPVVVLSAVPVHRPSAHNFDGMMQALADIATGPWTIESRHAPPGRESHEFADVISTIERVAKRHGVDIAEVRVAQSVPDAKGRHPRNEPIATPEPKLPPLGDRKRTTKTKASARAARFADRGGTDAVWHIDGRAIARDSVRMVEIPTGYSGSMAFTNAKDAEADPWADSAMHLTVEMLHRLDARTPEMRASVDGKAFRTAMLNKALSDEPVLRLHAGQLYVESGEPKQNALQVHLGPAEGANLLTKLDRKYLRPAMTKISGPLTIRVMGRGTIANAGGVLRNTPVEWGNDVVILDRADGERHIIGPMRLNSVERLNELDSRPIISGPAAEKPATNLAPGFTGLEFDDGNPTRARKQSPRIPTGLRDVEMERASSALTAAIERARFFIDPDDPTLRGMRIHDGLLVASDRKRLIEIAVEGVGPDRVIDVDGNRIGVDYPEPAELFPVVDPIATIDPAPLGTIANRLAKLTDSPVELMVNGPKLLLAGQPVRGAKVAGGSTGGSWFVSLHRLRPALMGAKSGRILFGTTGAPIVIERSDGERHLIAPSEAPCETCLIPAPPPEPPPAPPKGPDEAALAALLDRRLARYEASDTTRKLLLYPELAASLDAFAEVFGRRIAQVDRPFGIPELALDAHDARLLLAAHPAGVPLDRVADVDKLLREGWRLDGARLLPKDDYLSGDLWTRIARLDAIPDAYKRQVESQRREIEAAIGDISYPEIADRISLRDGWLPLHVIGAYLGSFRRDDKTPVAIERRDGVVQLANTRFTYDDMTDRFANTSSIRMVIGYINHDEQVFRPKKPQKEDINKVRRAKAELFERRFKAFLSTKPDLRDAIVDAYRRTHRGFVPRTYTGAPLQLARWGDLITPHPHQNAGARRAVDQRGMVAAYGVGVGKTFTACATVALARQNVGTRRPVILVPNSLVSKWQRDIHKALPDFAVVTIGEKATRGRDGALRYGPDDKADREVKWRRFAAGLYDLALVTPSAFLRTQLTPAEFEALAAGATELQRSVRLAQRTARGRTNPSERQQALLEQGVRAFLAQMMELPKSWEADDIRWSGLGVDLLIVDEAQNYKGLHSPETREGSIPRFMGQSSASKRAWNLDARARDVRGRNGFVVLLSATPAKNSPLELYNLWSYVNGELWRDHGIHDPEAFISRFLTIEPRLVIDATMEATERPAVTGFKHLDELKSILLRWGEFIQPPDIGLEVPEPTTELVEVEMDERQEAKYTRYIAQVEAELDAMRRGVKSNKILGLLARMGLVAVHAELDRGLKYKSAKGYDPESPKFTAIADYILANNTCGHIVFVQAIAAHRWLKETLVDRGIAADRIGILNAELAKSSDARQRIADRFNAGRLDVVIANSIAYEGLDLQTRTCAIHHADLPWEPATLNQRNGRAVRQGNTLSTVAIRYYFAQRSMDGLRFNLIQGKQGWMGALLEGSDAIANPGADLELGPDEILLLISRTPEETRKRLDALRAQAEAKRREEEAQRATKLLESGAGQLLEARDARTPDRAENLRAGAEAAFDALERIDPDIWPWRDLLRAARDSGAVEILGRHGSPPLFPGCWLRWEGDWHHVGRFGWEGTRRTVWLREPGQATWEPHKVSAVATRVKPDDVSGTKPADVTDDWQPDVARVVQRNLGEAWRGWRTLGWNHADPAWLEAAWPPIAADAEQRIAQIRSNAWTGSYGPPETRFPYAVDGVVHIQTRGGPPPPGAELLPPTAEGWARWLTLATSDDFKLTVRDEASKWWWGRPLRPGMQRTRQNPSRPRRNRWPAPAGAGAASTQMHSGDGMQLPAQTPIGTHLVLGIDHGQRLVWLDHARGARQAQAKQKDVPADIPLVAIVQVDNNAVAETRRPMAMSGGPVFVQPALMKTGGGIVIAADGTDAIASVIHARDLDAAYTANRRKVPQGIPRTVIGTIRYLYREAG